MNKDIKFNKKALDHFYETKEYSKLATILQDIHFSDVTDHIREWDIEKVVDFLSVIPTEKAAKIFIKFVDKEREEIVHLMNPEILSNILKKLFIDEIVDSFDEVSEEAKNKVLELLEPKKREKIDQLLKYHKNEVGFNMNVDFIAVKDRITIEQAKLDIKEQVNTKNLEIVGNIYVIDDDGGLLGFITADILLSKSDNVRIGDYIQIVKALQLDDSIAEADDIITKYDVTSVPVVSKDDKLIGVIYIDDILKRFEDINTSFLESSAIIPSDKKYLDSTIYELYKGRIPWIVLLLFIGTLTQVIITVFQIIWVNNGVFFVEDSVEAAAIVSLALATSLSVSSSVNDSAGNSGSQVSATMIRALAVGEIGEHDYWKAFKKEMIVALLIGVTIAVASFLRLFMVWGIMGFLDQESIHGFAPEGRNNAWVWGWLVVIGLISSTTFFISIIIGNILGLLLPIFSIKIKADGAVISGPVQTTVVDILTFTLYLSLTTAIFIPLNNSGVFDPVVATTTTNHAVLGSINDVFRNDFFNTVKINI